MELRLDGRTAIITGGAAGIGAATTRALVAVGAGVQTTDVLDAEGEAARGGASRAGTACPLRASRRDGRVRVAAVRTPLRKTCRAAILDCLGASHQHL